jgi:hypothetical protein
MNRHFSKPELSLMIKGRSSPVMTSWDLTFARGSMLSGFAKKLYRLSKVEREQAQEEIHGVLKMPDEDTTQIERWLEGIDDRIHQLDLPKNHPLLKAIQQNADYVSRQRIKFLRAEMYDINLATDRMVRFFELKHMYFPEATLGRDLTLRDLYTGDLEYWKTGFLQLLQDNDCSGRAVLILFGRIFTKVPTPVLVRQFRNLCNVALQEYMYISQTQPLLLFPDSHSHVCHDRSQSRGIHAEGWVCPC